MHKKKDTHDDIHANVDGINARNTSKKTHENEEDIDDEDDEKMEKDDESDGDDGVSNVLMSLLDISVDLLSLRGKAVVSHGSDDVDTNNVRGRR